MAESNHYQDDSRYARGHYPYVHFLLVTLPLGTAVPSLIHSSYPPPGAPSYRAFPLPPLLSL